MDVMSTGALGTTLHGFPMEVETIFHPYTKLYESFKHVG